MKQFPHDRKIEVFRADGSSYKTMESANLMSVHKFSESEVRVAQAFRAQSKPEDFLAKL